MLMALGGPAEVELPGRNDTRWSDPFTAQLDPGGALYIEMLMPEDAGNAYLIPVDSLRSPVRGGCDRVSNGGRRSCTDGDIIARRDDGSEIRYRRRSVENETIELSEVPLAP